MTIRKAKQMDVDAIVSIYEKIHDAEESGEITIGWIRGIYPCRNTAEAALERGDLFVQVTDEGEICGAAIINQMQAEGYEKAQWHYQTDDQNIMVLHTLVILPSFSGRGYGKAFVVFYEAYAQQQGCRYLRLDTNARNVRARSFYHKLGYDEAGVVNTDFNGISNIELVLLEKYNEGHYRGI